MTAAEEQTREDLGAHDGWLVPGVNVEVDDALLAAPNGETPGTVEAAGELPGAGFGRVDLGPIVRGDQPPVQPTMLCRVDGGCLLYPGGRHDIHGEPGSGKSMVSAAAVAEELTDGGRVVVLDYESTAAMFVERCQALGVPAAVLDDPARVAYFNPPHMSRGEVDGFADDLDSFDPTLLVIDAVGPAMGRQGLDENANADVARWHGDFVEVVRAGVTLLLVDHVSRDPGSRQRGGRGGWMKLQLLDVSYGVKAFKAFSRSAAGWMKLSCAKDRFGTFAVNELVAEIHVTPHDDGARIEIDVREPTTRAAGGDGWQPTGLMENLSIALERRQDAGEDPPNREQTLGLIGGRAEYKRKALNALIDGHHFEAFKDDTDRRHVRYRSVKPYRKDDSDNDSDSEPEESE